MLQKQFMCISLKDLRERVTIKIINAGSTKSSSCFAYAHPLLENKNCTKARVIFIFPENSFLFDGPCHNVHLHWRSKGYITFDVHQLKPHLLICVATPTVSTSLNSLQDQRSDQDQDVTVQ